MKSYTRKDISIKVKLDRMNRSHNIFEQQEKDVLSKNCTDTVTVKRPKEYKVTKEREND